MSDIIDYINKTCSWNSEYTISVIYEYERFIQLKSVNENVLPSEDIYKVWRNHIIFTDEYYKYCFQRYNKLINFEINKYENNNGNNNDKITRLLNTLTLYKSTFGEITHKNVWNCNIILNIEELTSYVNNMNNINNTNNFNSMNNTNNFNSMNNMNNFNSMNNINNANNFNMFVKPIDIPSYNENKPLTNDEFKFYIYYKNSIGSNPNIDKKMFSYKLNDINETIEKFIDMVSLQTGFDKTKINILLHPSFIITNYEKILFLIDDKYLRSNIYLNNLLKKSYNFILIELNNI